MVKLLLVFKWRIVQCTDKRIQVITICLLFKKKNLTKRRSKLMEEAEEEHHWKATKAKGRRRLEKENIQVSTRNSRH